MASTPLRSVRIDDERWDRLQAKAKRDHSNASELIRQYIDTIDEEA